MPRTVRVRIAVLAALAVTVLLVVSSAALVVVQRHTLTDHVDQGLSDRADEIRVQFTREPTRTVLTGLGDEDTLGQVVGSDGSVLAVSDNARGLPPLAGLPEGSSDDLLTIDVPVDTARYGLLTRRAESASGVVTIHVAASLDDVGETIRLLQRTLVISIPLAREGADGPK